MVVLMIFLSPPVQLFESWSSIGLSLGNIFIPIQYWKSHFKLFYFSSINVILLCTFLITSGNACSNIVPQSREVDKIFLWMMKV